MSVLAIRYVKGSTNETRARVVVSDPAPDRQDRGGSVAIRNFAWNFGGWMDHKGHTTWTEG
jgi:hypothetical protein